jgi:nicotinamidase-related amidase
MCVDVDVDVPCFCFRDIDPRDSSTCLNLSLLGSLQSADQVLVCGQALSHCVRYTVEDMIKHWGPKLERIVILEDATSCVEGFNEEGQEFLTHCKKRGVTVTTTEDVFNVDKLEISNDIRVDVGVEKVIKTLEKLLRKS